MLIVVDVITDYFDTCGVHRAAPANKNIEVAIVSIVQIDVGFRRQDNITASVRIKA